MLPTVLVVEDDEILQSLTADAISLIGICVVVAHLQMKLFPCWKARLQ